VKACENLRLHAFSGFVPPPVNRMIVGLHGRMQGMRLIHAHSDHPEHRESEIRGIPVIDLNDPDPQFQIYV
jgi:hypothetical protein